MKTLTSRNRFWPLALVTLAAFGLIFGAIAYFFHTSLFVVGFLFAAIVLGLLARKIVRELTFDGHRYTLTYMQWGFPHTETFDASDVLVGLVTSDMGRNVWRQSFKITDHNHRLLYDLRTGDGFDLEDLKAFAGAVQS